MKNSILKYTLKALILALMLAILATGALAVHLSHVYVTVTYTLGEEPAKSVAMADVLSLEQLAPLPLHKPKKGN